MLQLHPKTKIKLPSLRTLSKDKNKKYSISKTKLFTHLKSQKLLASSLPKNKEIQFMPKCKIREKI